MYKSLVNTTRTYEDNEHHKILRKINDADEIGQLCKENELFDASFTFSIYQESKRFIQFSGQMLLAFPIGLLMRKIIRKNKQLNYILQFPALQAVRNNIEKGSFAYDTLLFKLWPHQIVANKRHLANLVCLALLFGDEFIDGIAQEYGKEPIQKILNCSNYNFNLQYQEKEGDIVLYYPFDIRTILPITILNKQNKKYAISYAAFYEHLLFLLNAINTALKKQQKDTAIIAASLICRVCNNCFATYRKDVQAYTPNYNWNTLLQYMHSKDDAIVSILLALRGTLLQKNTSSFQKHYTSWATIVRSMQVYDDMQDIASDCDYQMNILGYIAYHFFAIEWQWLQHHKKLLATQNVLQIQQQIALYMPGSVMLCMQYNKNITHKNLNWVQQKIQNYLWQKNWLGSVAQYTPIQNNHTTSLFTLAKHILTIKHTMLTENMLYAHILDTALLFAPLQKNIYQKVSKKEKYLLKNFYTTLPTSIKASILQKLML